MGSEVFPPENLHINHSILSEGGGKIHLRMYCSLVSPVGSIIEVFVTGDTVPLLFSLMPCHMFFQACLSSKSLPTEVTLPGCVVTLMISLHVSFHNLSLFEQLSTQVALKTGIRSVQGLGVGGMERKMGKEKVEESSGEGAKVASELVGNLLQLLTQQHRGVHLQFILLGDEGDSWAEIKDRLKREDEGAVSFCHL